MTYGPQPPHDQPQQPTGGHAGFGQQPPPPQGPPPGYYLPTGSYPAPPPPPQRKGPPPWVWAIGGFALALLLVAALGTHGSSSANTSQAAPASTVEPSYTTPPYYATTDTTTPDDTSTYSSNVTDTALVNLLQQRGIPYSSTTAAVSDAHEVCSELDNGDNFVQVVGSLMSVDSLTTDQAAYFTGAAIAGYCPQHKSDIPS